MAEELGVCVMVLTADDAPLQRGMTKAKAEVERSAGAMQASMDKRLAGMSKSMGRVGSEMTHSLTIPIIGLGGAAVKMGADFDGAMERIHTQAGASQKEVNKLKGEVLDLAKHSAQGPTDLADALYRLEGAGLHGAKAMRALREASNLAAVGNARVEDTAKTLSQIYFTGIKGAGDFQKVVGEVNATVGAGDLRLQSLVDALGTGLPAAAKTVGLSFHDITGALAVFGDETNNVSGWSAQLATAFHFLTDPTQKAQGALESMGIGASQLNDDMHKPKGLLTALSDLKTHLEALPGGLHGPKAAEILGDILPGGRGRVLVVLMNQLDRYRQKMEQIKDTTSEFSSDVQKTQQTTQYKIHAAWAKIQADAVTLGQTLGPDFLKVGQEIADEADKIATAFSKLPPGTQQMIIKGGLITAGIGPALKVLSIFTGGISKLMTLTKTVGGLIAGEKALFRMGGKGKGISGAAVQRVATMEVAEMVVRSSTGFGGAGGGLAKTAAGDAEKAAGEAGGLAAIKSFLPKLLGRGVGGLAIGATGAGISQILKQVIGGSTGNAIGTVGTDASVGAGVGSLFGPEGTLAGAFAGSLYGGWKHFVQDPGVDKDAKDLADRLTRPLGPTIQKKVAPSIQQALTEANRALKTAQQHAPTGAYAPNAISAGSAYTPAQLAQMRREISQATPAFRKAGRDLGLATVAGLQSVKFTSAPVLMKDFNRELNQLPIQARPAAAKVMAQFAQQLNQSGKLPKDQFDKVIKQLEKEIPGLQGYLKQHAPGIGKALADNMNLDGAQKQLKKTTKQMGVDLGVLPSDMKITGANLNQTAAKVMRGLHNSIANSTGAARQRYQSELHKMQQVTNQTFDGMEQKVNVAQGKITNKIQQGSLQARIQANKNFGKFADQIYNAMDSGVLSTGKGMKLITDALNSTLKALGTKQLPKTQMPGSLPKSSFPNAGNSPRGQAATGALMQVGQPGERGHDNIPMSVGGTDIVVGRGEQVAVLNHDQQSLLNHRLSDMGGLGGMFRKVNRPHYLARGGLVGTTPGRSPRRLATGGNVWEVRTSQEAAASGTGWTELSPNGNAAAKLGIPHSFSNNPAHYPDFASLGKFYGHGFMLKIRNGSRSGTWPMTDEGDGSSYAPAIGLTPAVSGALGGAGGTMQITAADGSDIHLFPGMGRLIAGTGGFAAAGPGGVAGALKQLMAPQAKGGGAVTTIVNAAMKKIADAANKYEAAHQPAPTGGGGVGPTFPVHPGPVPAPVQRALQAAQAIAARHPDYGHEGAGWGLSAYDCSSYVSTVMDAAGIWPKWVYYTAAGPINDHTVPGPGKWITIATRGTSGDNAHTMMEIDGHFFESSHTGVGPHVDSGWSEPFTWYRHPAGYARGGMLTRIGHQPTQADADAIQAARKRLGGIGSLWDTTGNLRTQNKVAGANMRMFADGGFAVDAKHAKRGKGKDDKKKKPAPSRAQQLRKIAQEAKKRIPKYKRVKLPHLAAIPGFQTAAMTNLANMDNEVGELGNYLGYLDNLFSTTGEVEPLVTVTDKDGNSTEVINWGSLQGRKPPAISGMIDPETGQRTKGIYDRLREIGNPSDQSRASLLGVENLILGMERSQRKEARKLARKLKPWLDKQDARARIDDRQVAWLSQALDLTQPMPKWLPKWKEINGPQKGHGLLLAGSAIQDWGKPVKEPLSKDVLEKVKEFRNAQAQIDRWEDLKKEIPGERRKREDQITNRFDKMRHRVENSSAKKTFSASGLMNQTIQELERERADQLHKIPLSPPKKWKGDRKAWEREHQAERDQVDKDFEQRIDAVRQSVDKKQLHARLKKSNALSSLSKQERADRTATELSFSNLENEYQDLITGERTLSSSDRHWLTSLKTAIGKQSTSLHSTIKTANTSSDGAKAVLDSYLDPYGALSLEILQTKNIDIPSLLQEAAGLKGTIVPKDLTATGDTGDTGGDTTGDTGGDDTTTTDTSQSTALLQQLLASSRLAYDVSQAQYKAFKVKDLPPFGGSFLNAGVVPGMRGEPKTVILHGGERVLRAGEGDGGDWQITHNYANGMEWLSQFVDSRIEHNGRVVAQKARGRRALAGNLRP
jgi:TP901 family phage tail tape measure protein